MRFAAAELRRLSYVRFLIRRGLLTDHPLAEGPAADGVGQPRSAGPAPPSRPRCWGCLGVLRPIWYGPAGRQPGDVVFDGQVAEPDDPAYACARCRRYYDDDGVPFCGPADPQDLG
jgi:hypothetical protein